VRDHSPTSPLSTLIAGVTLPSIVNVPLLMCNFVFGNAVPTPTLPSIMTPLDGAAVVPEYELPIDTFPSTSNLDPLNVNAPIVTLPPVSVTRPTLLLSSLNPTPLAPLRKYKSDDDPEPSLLTSIIFLAPTNIQIKGTSAGKILITDDTSGHDSTDGLAIQHDNSDTTITNNEAGTLKINTDTSDCGFQMDANGNVSIGPTCPTPSYPLHVIGAAYASGQSIIGGTSTVQGNSFSVGGSTLVVGDYLRIGTAAGANGAVAQGSAVYLVTKIDSLKVYLDRPVTSVSGTYDDAGGTTAVEVIPSATGLAATWGIRCTGIAISNFKPGVFNYRVVRFKLEPQNCGTTAVTYTTAASEGSGVYGQVAELEWFAQGNLGKIFRVDTPPVTMHAQASSAKTYETIAIKYKTSGYDDSVTATTPRSHGEIILAFVYNSDSGDKIIATLTEWTAAQLGYSVAW